MTFPKVWGGWGLLDQHIFGKELLIKSLWHVIWGCGIWQEIFKHKYLRGRDDVHIYRGYNNSLSNGLMS